MKYLERFFPNVVDYSETVILGAFKFLVFVMFVLSSGGSYQELAILSNSVGGWKHNDSHILRQEGNFSHSPVNRTLILPAEAFDPLGGHTIWQVTISLSWCLANTAIHTCII